MATKPRKESDSYQTQLNILRALSSGGEPTAQVRPILIDQIAVQSGVSDEREAQRILYILEGHKLVTPHPAGDFTSRHWQITSDGIQALRIAAEAMPA